MAGNEIEISKTKYLRTLYEEFGERTSMHGIGRVITNTSMCSRFVWSVLTLFGLGFATYQFVTTMTDYYSYPVTTIVNLKSEQMALFPGITICNLNRKKNSMMTAEVQEAISKLLSVNEFEIDLSPHDTALNALMQRDFYNSSYNHKGHIMSQMLIKCVFNRMPCSKLNFDIWFSASYGACYKFLPADYNFPYSTRPGPQYGLILELNIEQYEYLSISSKAGVKVIVHPRDEFAFPEDGGILAQPGAATSIGIKKIITHRLPAPYSTCVSEQRQPSSQPSVFDQGWRYIQKACMKSCFQFVLYETCKCCDFDVPCNSSNFVKFFNITERRFLQFCSNTTNLDCQRQVENKFLNSELDCDDRCPLACDRTTFDTVVSEALWPSDSSFEAFAKIVNGTVLQTKSFAENTSLERFIRSNLLRLEIFFDSFEFQEFTTQAKYDWNLLLGTIGGLLGLWLGFSLLTAMEIVEVLVYTGLYYTRRKHKITIQPKTN